MFDVRCLIAIPHLSPLNAPPGRDPKGEADLQFDIRCDAHKAHVFLSSSNKERTKVRSRSRAKFQSPKEMSTSRAVWTISPLGGTSFRRLTASAIGTWRT